MVNEKAEQRDKVRKYALQTVKDLASKGKVNLLSSKVQNDLDSLGYAPSNVYDCICSIKESEYRESIKYPNKRWCDVYITEYKSPSGLTDRLYIKLMLSNGCLSVSVASFHLEGSL